MRKQKIIGGKHCQRKELNIKRFLLMFCIIVLTIVAASLVRPTMAKYVLKNDLTINVATANFYFSAEAQPNSFNTIEAITANINTRNYENNNITSTDITYTATASNAHYDITLENDTASLIGGQNSTGCITLNAIPKTGVELNDTETIQVTITTSKPFIYTQTVNIEIDTRFTVTYEYNNATEGNSETSKRVRYNHAYGTLPNPGRSYEIEYNTDGGTSVVTQTVSHAFDGWYKEELFETSITSESIVNVARNHSIYAKWALSSVRLGQTSKIGYTFDGWYENSAFTGIRYDEGDLCTPTSDKTMYAKWNLDEYTISYDLDGGIVQSTNPTTYTVEDNDITLNNPIKTGYTFTGWTGSNGNVANTSVTILHGSTGNKSYTANWVINSSNLTINPNGGSVNITAYGENNATTINSATTYLQDYNTTLTLDTPTKGDTTDTGTKYTITYDGNGGNISKLSDTATRTIVTEYTFNDWTRSTPFYGILQNGTYTFSSESGVSSMITADYTSSVKSNTVSSVATANATREYTVTYNHNYTNSLNTTKTSTYTMNGWYTARSGGTKRADNNEVYTPSQTEVLYAQWTSSSITYVPTRTGYSFDGWYTNEACTNAATGTNGIYTPTSDITLYAKWTSNSYTVTYQYNGATGGNNNATKSVNFGSIYGDLATPERVYTVSYSTDGGSAVSTQTSAYTFSGWYKENVFTNLVTRDTTVTNASNHSLYAKWISTEVRLGESEKTGYTLEGWYDNSGLTGTLYEANTNYTPTANVTMYAKWSINSYTVTYNYSTNGGTSATKTSDTKNYDTNIDLTPTATKSGWNFLGWNTNQNATVGLTTLKMGTNNVTLYAIYSKQLTLYFNQASGSVTTKSATIYNNSTSTTLQAATIEDYSGYTAIGWTTSHTPTTTGTIASNATGVSVSTSNTGTNYYAVYKKSIRATFIDYNSSTKTTNYSSYVDKVTNTYNLSNETYPTITTRTLNTYSSSYTNAGWSASTALDTTDIIEQNTNIQLTDNTTFYGIYRKTYTATFKDYLGTEANTWYGYSHVQKSSYSISSTEVTIPLVMPTPSDYTGWTGLGWSTGTTSTYTTSTPTYAIGSTVNLTANKTYYARYSMDVTLTFIDYNGTTKQTRTVTGTRQAYAYSNRYSNPTLTAPTISTYTGWTAYGWTTGTSSTAGRNYSSGASISGVTQSATYYARYNKTVTANFKFYGYERIRTYSSESSYTTDKSAYGIVNRAVSANRCINSYNINNIYNPTVNVETTESRTTGQSSTYPYTETYSYMYTYTTFLGWTDSTTSTSENDIVYYGGETITLTEDLTYYAIQKKGSAYTVKYYDITDTTATNYTVSTYARINAYNYSTEVCESVTLANANTYTDWEFIGWATGTSKTATVTNQPGDVIVVNANKTFYARYSQDVTLTFIDYNGSTKRTQTVTGTRNASGYYGTSVSNPTITSPTIAAYNDGVSNWTIVGWTTETGANVSYQKSSGASISGVTTPATYYARYNKSVTAYFYFYGRTTSKTYSKDDNGNVTSTTNSDTYGTITRSKSGTRYVNSYDITNTINPDVSIETCASNTTNSGSTTYPHTEVTTQMSTYTTLVGWTTSTSSFEIEIGNSGNITLLQTIYYYAIQQNTVNATFYSYSGTSQIYPQISTHPRINAYNSSNVRYDTIAIPEAGTFTDWTYVGWTTSTGKTEAATTPTKYTGDTLEITSAVTYYAIYERPVNIVYNLNGGTGDIPDTVVYRRKNAYSTTASYVYTPPATITSLTPTRSGYTFLGWNTNQTSTSPSSTYDAGKTYTVGYSVTTFNLYAIWSMDTYTIEYTLNDGTVATANPTSYNVTTSTFTLNNPTKTGYTFLGWTGSNGTTPQTTITITQGSTGNRTYTANWSRNTYSIGYTLNGGTVSGTNPTSYNVTTSTFTLINPIKNGYRFLGWTGTNGTTPEKTITITQGSTGNRTYTANWELVVLSVGDFVNYNAGTWTQSEITAINATGSRTNSTGSSYYWMFEGFAVGDSRNEDATPYSTSYATVASGWRVFDIDTANNTVTLISAGNPENYLAGATSPSSGYQTGYIGEYRMGHTTTTPTYSTFKNKNYVSRTWNEYVNTSQHAISATSLNIAILQEWYNKYVDGVTSSTPITTATNMQKVYGTRYESIVDNHTYYWFATNVTSGRYLYRYVANASKGSIASATGSNARGPFGVRVLVTLSGASFTYANQEQEITRVNTYSYGVWNIS